jgi:hypothetical protein
MSLSYGHRRRRRNQLKKIRQLLSPGRPAKQMRFGKAHSGKTRIMLAEAAWRAHGASSATEAE